MKRNSASFQTHTDSPKPTTITINTLGEKNRPVPSGCGLLYFFHLFEQGTGEKDQTGLGKVHPDPCRASVNPRTPCRALRKQTTLLRLFLFNSAGIVHLKLREGDRIACREDVSLSCVDYTFL